jgi:protein involved in polysaccharide export with SLBB domain
VAVTGSVRNPAIYELRGDETLQQVLASAGGVTTIAAESRVSIERIQEHHDRQAMELAYDASGLATPLVDGDLVRVFPIVARYQKTVTLRGNTANPGRFSWHAGMHVSELIPDKDSLLTRNYWWRRTQLGLPAPEFEPIPGFENLRQPTDNHAVSVERSLEEGRMAANREARLQGQAGNETTAQAAQPQTQPAAGQQGQTGNSGDDQNTQDQMQQGSMGSGTGAAQHAGSASIAETQNAMNNPLSPFGQKTDVKALAPEIDWDYAVVERLNPDTLKTVLIPFDLGKLVLEHDSSQDLELQAADIVSIFSGADIRLPLAHQTKFVRLDGEVAHAGVYTVQPGETLRQLVERAGGVTSNAYLYGSEFTRESTRAIQQARIDEYARTLGLQIQRRNLATEPPPTQAPGATQTVPVEPDLIASLRRIRATGRIVLNFNPQQSGTSSIPELTLEDGDRFSIPPVPATVNVVGAVYDQNSFLFNRERKTGTYLRLAGGANRDADRGREFIIRADGEVVSRARSRSLWSGDEFNHLDINPGDTIVVPDKTYKPSLWNSVLSSASTLGSFAVDAAILTTIQ